MIVNSMIIMSDYFSLAIGPLIKKRMFLLVEGIKLMLVPIIFFLQIEASCDTQVLNMQIDIINSIVISDSAQIFIDPDNTLPSGDIYGDSTNTTYGCLTNENSLKKITARLDATLPDTLTLKATLGPPTGATNYSEQVLTTTDITLVDNIPAYTNQASLSITYRAEASPSIIGTFVRRVIFTFSNQ